MCFALQIRDRSKAYPQGPGYVESSCLHPRSLVEPVRYTTDSRRRMAVYYGARNRPLERVRLSELTARLESNHLGQIRRLRPFYTSFARERVIYSVHAHWQLGCTRVAERRCISYISSSRDPIFVIMSFQFLGERKTQVTRLMS